ncbi:MULTISPECIES: hypothetical protein [Pseudomonas]|uniref:hypothetical protein n=1 Tax=Pseudomonas TaxID=286 RepID=UPI00193AE03D|nr:MULTISPECIES: hypothetical protein [Pseudomonas]MBH9460838.1 hypothetical protein [Pseudomonas aeruginosa]MBH9462290.1 hypothetical protein [Pseudomonas aeruginosa]MBM2564627.1 hypothetical protein [Pseudomonas sp. AF1]MBM2583693.1 hypothetical protein [Pseudomonas sp. AFW1]MBM2591239.1 hypothetical protein [Pseudomonas sp. BIS]
MRTHSTSHEKTAEEINFHLRRANELLSAAARTLIELAADITASGNVQEAQQLLRVSNRLEMAQMDLADTEESLYDNSTTVAPASGK